MPERTGQGLEPIPPRLNLAMVRLLHGLLPLLLRFRWFVWLPARIEGLELVEGERLVEAFRRFQAGELRLILAFRHGEVDDPLAALWLLSRGVPALARRHGVRLRLPLHAQFLYDRGMPLWGGRGLGWVLSRLGGVSLRRGRRPDWTALRTSRRLVLEGTCPFAVAPEGATNGHGEQLGPLEKGVAQLGVWCVQDLDRAGRTEAVWIVPISLQYRYCRQNWGALETLLARLERLVGLATDRVGTRPEGDAALRLYPRLLAIGNVLLEQLEQFYERLTPQPRPGAPTTAAQGRSTSDSPGRGERIRALLDRALAVAENRLGLSGGGTPEERCRRLEEEGWRRQFREDLPPRFRLVPLDRALSDWLARDAATALLHMRLAESLVAVSGDYVASHPSFERFAETALLLHDALERLQGARLPRRPGLGARQVRLTVGDPIRLRPEGKPPAAAGPVGPGNGGRQRQRTAAITARIQAAFEQALI